jgi:hypothetical protein
MSELTGREQASGERKNTRGKGPRKLKSAVAAFVADLLHARNHPEADGWVYRPLAKGSFTGQAVSSRDFTSIREAWTACGLLEVKPGYTETVEFDPGDPIRTRGKASRFHATLKMLKTCAEHGVTPQDVSEHRVGSWKEPGKPMEFERKAGLA